MKDILLVGDWLIDEHWLTGIHRSATSSRVGQSHFRGLQSKGCAIHSFCGAGQTASALLRSVDDNGSNQFRIFGIGIWSDSDTDFLSSMLDQKDDIYLTPYRMIYDDVPTPNNNVTLFNISKLLDKETQEQHIGTTNVIRIYQNTGKDVELLQRIDWELELPDEYRHGWINKALFHKLEGGLLEDALDSFSDKFEAIIIKDLCKGTISKYLIRFLVKKYPQIPWYVSTKAWGIKQGSNKLVNDFDRWKPDWLEELTSVDLQLFLIPQIPARNIVDQGEIGYWLTKYETPSIEAMDVIEDFSSLFRKRDKLSLIVLSGGFSVLGVENTSDFLSYMRYEPREKKFPFGLPMASLFFASVVCRMLENHNETIKDTIDSSLEFVKMWTNNEAKRIISPENWKPTKVPIIQKYYKSKTFSAEKDFFDWQIEKKRWKEAHNLYGIIKDEEGGLSFQLWRGMPDLEGYICLSPTKKAIINLLKKELRAFKHLKNRSSKAYLIQASPGSGKSFLISSLAKDTGFQLLSFNISQMLSKRDLLDCFDTIITTQFRKKSEQPIIVFIDEINARIQHEYAYDLFLQPLEDGTFVRAGKTYPIHPFVWIFVGTESSAEMRGNDTKANDFISRLDLPPQTFGSLGSNDTSRENTKTEIVYIGVSLLKQYYPDVQWVSEKVLKTFYEFPKPAIRDIKHFVKAFLNIQYGKVLSDNIPIDWLQVFRSGFDFKAYRSWDEGNLVWLE